MRWKTRRKRKILVCGSSWRPVRRLLIGLYKEKFDSNGFADRLIRSLSSKMVPSKGLGSLQRRAVRYLTKLRLPLRLTQGGNARDVDLYVSYAAVNLLNVWVNFV